MFKASYTAALAACSRRFEGSRNVCLFLKPEPPCFLGGSFILEEVIKVDQTSYGKDMLSDEETEICHCCGNIYRIIWLKEGDDYNDFGFRHCPFCGLVIDEYAQLVREEK